MLSNHVENTLRLSLFSYVSIPQKFISTKRFYLENRTQEVNQVLKRVQSMQLEVHDAVKSLNFIDIPDESSLSQLAAANPLDIVESYIEVCYQLRKNMF